MIVRIAIREITAATTQICMKNIERCEPSSKANKCHGQTDNPIRSDVVSSVRHFDSMTVVTITLEASRLGKLWVPVYDSMPPLPPVASLI